MDVRGMDDGRGLGSVEVRPVRGGGAAARGPAGRLACGERGGAAGGGGAAQPARVPRRHAALPQGARAALPAGLLRDDHGGGAAGGLPGGDRVRRVRGAHGPGVAGGGGRVPQPEQGAPHGAGGVDLPLRAVVAAAGRAGPGAGRVGAAVQRRRGASKRAGDGRRMMVAPVEHGTGLVPGQVQVATRPTGSRRCAS